MPLGYPSNSTAASPCARNLTVPLRDILRFGFSPELEGKLLAEFARKATVTAEDVESCRADLRTFEARGWSITDHHARLDKLTTATARMAR
jgi:hypothetical protein